jgi:IclR family KDG regulon transcriptional repressor
MNNTLIKGLKLLELLARSDVPMGVTDLARGLLLPKSNVHSLLQALVAMGYARQLPDSRRYCASIRLWELGSAVLVHLDLKRAAQPFMARLQMQTREAVHLSILDGDEVVYVHKIESDEPVRAYSDIGGRAPAHCVATGKALLAWQSDASQQNRAVRLTPYSPRTIVEAAAFLRTMKRIRRQGYAVNRGEWRDTVGGVAAPILGELGQVIAAVGISGPLPRLGPARMRTLAPLVMKAAEQISEELSPRAALVRLW